MSDELLDEFIFDSREHLSAAGAQLLELEKNPASLAALNTLMGTMHTIKGNSGFLDLANLYQLLHHAESLLQTVREKQCACPQKMIDLLLQVLDTVESLLDRLENGDNDQVEWLGALNQALSESEASLEASESPPAARPPQPAGAPSAPEEVKPAAPGAPPAPPVTIKENLSGKINLLPLRDGQLAEEGENFPARVEAMFAVGLRGLVVDLRSLASVSGRELKMLMTVGRRNPAKTAFLLNLEAQSSLYRIFQVLQLDSFMHFFPDQDPALTYIRNS
ncbi:MAG: Hpt domain-containing protein [Candidatus Adiutrix sp.]|jgi:chemotaxis protein histidine kinase CheA|nr:Hpt domain-containing protein [Candidatus Adiutrix sp.]